MTNQQIQERTELIHDRIDDIKFRQKMEEDEEIAKCYDGMIDDLELIIINLPVEGVEEGKCEWEEQEEFLNTEEGREQAQNEAEDMKAQEGEY